MDALKFAEFFSLKYLPYGLKMLPWQYLDAARYCRYDFLWFCKTALWLEISIFSVNQSKWYENLLEFTSLGKYQVRKVSFILLVMTLVWFFMFFSELHREAVGPQVQRSGPWRSLTWRGVVSPRISASGDSTNSGRRIRYFQFWIKISFFTKCFSFLSVAINHRLYSVGD